MRRNNRVSPNILSNRNNWRCSFSRTSEGLDRLQTLSNQIARLDNESSRTSIFGSVRKWRRSHIASPMPEEPSGTSRSAWGSAGHYNRLSLIIDQACGTNLDAVLDARRRMAAESGRLEDLASLAALLANLHEFEEAESIYHRALREYQDVSPFAIAWVCFQLGVLSGRAS